MSAIGEEYEGMMGTQAGSRHVFDVVLMCALALVAGATSMRAVMIKSAGDLSYITNAPSGTLTNSGWQYEGTWGNFLGTPIAPTYFIAADHVGGSVGDPFILNGFTYHTVATSKDTNSDLRIWKVDATFPIYAPLYTTSDESNKHVVVFGRGTERGSSITVSSQLKGWQWGTTNYVERWGENDVASVTNMPGYGPLIRCSFDRSAGSNECQLSIGDSSGGLFIQDGSTWKLAGINYLVEGGPFSNAVDGTVFPAALLDVGGLYVPGDGMYPDTPQDNPTSFYSTRISAELAWINSVIDFLPGPDLKITAIQVIGNDISISFATTNRLYYVQRIDDLGSGTWTTFTNNVMGTNGVMSVLDTNAASLPQRFYRVGLVQ